MAEVKVNASVTYACPIHDLAMMDEIIQNLESRYAQIEGYRGREGMDPVTFERYAVMFGLDRPWYVRLGDYFVSFLRFDFKESLRYGRPVLDVIVERMPVTMGLGIIGALFTYLICIPLGIAKARRDGAASPIRSGIVSNWLSCAMPSRPV